VVTATRKAEAGGAQEFKASLRSHLKKNKEKKKGKKGRGKMYLLVMERILTPQKLINATRQASCPHKTGH
jgi:hypothetical protein